MDVYRKGTITARTSEGTPLKIDLYVHYRLSNDSSLSLEQKGKQFAKLYSMWEMKWDKNIA